MQKVQEFLDKYNLCPFERKLTKYELTKMNEILKGKEYNGQNNWISYFYGSYNECERKDYVMAEKYYLISISHGNASAMYNLGYLYEYHKKYYLAEKYYLMSIAKGGAYAMNNLGYMYTYRKKYDKAVKYYLMAIYNRHISAVYLTAMNNLRKIPDKELYPQLIKYPESKEAKQIISDLIKDRDILLIHNKLQTCVREGGCSICMADDTGLVLSSCYFHSFCVECSLKISVCAICRVH